jgi:predicted RND superfamily exporter protein
MYKFGRFVVKYHIAILVIGLVLLVPALFGYLNTRVNYDMLTYLPDSIETMQGQEILSEQFGKGAFSLVVVEGMDDQDVAELEDQIKQIDHVDSVLGSGSLTSANVPKQVIPEKYYEAFNNGDATMFAVFFDTSTSAEETQQAITQIRSKANEQVFISGMSAMVTDLRNLAEKEEPIYVGVAVLCSVIVLLALTDSWLVPFIFLASIGMAILYNMGTNIFLGQISYITKALAAVLQLAVTMDFSIFLWHSFTEKFALYPDDKQRAMSEAIGDTLIAITSSGMTATAGFLALCFMTYRLGMDLGIVMAKGCILGLISAVTILPSLVLVFEKWLEKTRHRTLIPSADRLSNAVANHYVALIIVFAIILVPAIVGFNNKPVYYQLSNGVANEKTAQSMNPDDIKYFYADQEVKDKFDVATTEMVLCDSNMSHADAKEMLQRFDDVDGVKYAVGYDSLAGGLLPDQAIPEDVRSLLKSGDYQLILINSSYDVASDEVNNQIDELNSIMKEYDPNGMLIGEAPATKDLISITDHDFQVVDIIAIVAILIILFIVFRSPILPFILVAVIEFAICVNLGIPYYTGNAMPFIGPVVVSTIQLGSTVNYAILMTTRYRKERHDGMNKHDSIMTALSASLPSIVTSAVSFFGATFGVAIYSNMNIISSLCGIMARGALISMLSVLFLLPSFFMVFDKIIVKTSRGFDRSKDKKKGSKPGNTQVTEVSA